MAKYYNIRVDKYPPTDEIVFQATNNVYVDLQSFCLNQYMMTLDQYKHIGFYKRTLYS